MEFDICFCSNKECPKYYECLRGGVITAKPYLSTFADFSTLCNKEEGYKYFIEE